MGTIIPTINSCSATMTGGEKRLARRLESVLPDNCLCWYDIHVGRRHRYPDFIVLNPEIGLLFIEVKDWKAANILEIDKERVLYHAPNGIASCTNPLKQVRQSCYDTLDVLTQDPLLIQQAGNHQGKLAFPYGYGVYLSNITRKQLEKLLPDRASRDLLPPELVICKDELTESMSDEAICQRLWQMFTHRFPATLSPQQIDRVRWHLYPEIRIASGCAERLKVQPGGSVMPEIIRIMDTQQELLARSLGEGHRVIHGVAGSGKTLILVYRCVHLANQLEKPILVLCYNIIFAARLKALITAHQLSGKVEIAHFHSWCYRQIQKYGLQVVKENNYYEDQVKAVQDGIDSGKIPAEQYGAVLIDEGNDFDQSWIKILPPLVCSKTGSLLFMYDDAQSIYRKRGTLAFSLASVGIQAQGRTSVLKMNYRNSRQVLTLASTFAANYLNDDSKNSSFSLPEAGGPPGCAPEFTQCASLEEEAALAVQWIKAEHRKGVPWNNIAIICPSLKEAGPLLKERLKQQAIPCYAVETRQDKKNYHPDTDSVTILPLPSSKGLEFHSVMLIDSSHILSSDEDDLTDDVKRLYVGMTRATRRLLVSLHRKNPLAELLQESYNEAARYF